MKSRVALLVLFGGLLTVALVSGRTAAQSPLAEPTIAAQLAQQFAQPDGYEVDALDLPGHHVNKLVVVRDRRTNVTCYVWGETMVCLNTYEYGR